MGQTILVVDDSPTTVKFVSFSLKNSGFNVVTAKDGMEAIETLSNLSENVDMIITDLNMPNLDGYGLIEAVRLNHAYRRIPIVILSAEGSDDDRARGVQAGATSYLVKPFKSDRLLNEVKKHLR